MKDEIKETLDNTLEYLEGIDETRNIKILTINETNILLDYITNLQDKIKQYEDPEDLTLFYMWLDEKAKDKMKQLQEENERLKQERQNIDNRNRNQKMANRKLQEEIESVRKNNRTRKSRCKKQTKKKNMYKTRNEKAIEYIKNNMENIIISQNRNIHTGQTELGLKKDYVKRQPLLNILQGKSDE